MGRFVVFIVLAMLGASSCGGRLGGDRTLIQHKGSDTLLNVAQAWAEAYGRVNSEAAVALTGGGSGTGISAIINGTADVASASRKMTTQELDTARQNGADPHEFTVGYDAIAVYLHPDNPIESFTFRQLAGIYGEGGEIENWSQLGVEVPGCTGGAIVRVSRQNSSGTHRYFLEDLMGRGGDYKLGSHDMHASKDVVTLVSTTPCAIGYSSLVFATDDVKMPCIAEDDGSPCLRPSLESAIDGTHPFARPLLLYTPKEPEGVIKDYLNWILSDDGQCIAQQRGYAPARPVDCP